jgi:hypothetical protein
MKSMKHRFMAAASVAALVISARAEIVYTPVNVTINVDNQYHIDLNGDGIIDFTIRNHSSDQSCIGWPGYIGYDKLAAAHRKGNELVQANGIGAAALAGGVEVGQNQSFKGNGLMAEYASGWIKEFGMCWNSPYSWGNWIGVDSAYLGVEFLINGELHYGWIACSGGLTPTVTGFAYETVAGQSIVTGQTSGP